MGSGNKKKGKKTNWGNFYRSEYQNEAMRWCINNGIAIGPLAAEPGDGPSHFWIEIVMGKKRSRSPHKYLAKDVWNQIYNYYIYYYEKHRDTVS